MDYTDQARQGRAALLGHCIYISCLLFCLILSCLVWVPSRTSSSSPGGSSQVSWGFFFPIALWMWCGVDGSLALVVVVGVGVGVGVGINVYIHIPHTTYIYIHIYTRSSVPWSLEPAWVWVWIFARFVSFHLLGLVWLGWFDLDLSLFWSVLFLSRFSFPLSHPSSHTLWFVLCTPYTFLFCFFCCVFPPPCVLLLFASFCVRTRNVHTGHRDGDTHTRSLYFEPPCLFLGPSSRLSLSRFLFPFLFLVFLFPLSIFMILYIFVHIHIHTHIYIHIRAHTLSSLEPSQPGLVFSSSSRFS